MRDASNAHLRPHPVAVIAAEQAPDDFDARFSATKRHYLYRIINRRADLTFERGLRLARRQAARTAGRCMSPRNASSASMISPPSGNVECQAKSPVKTLDQLDVQPAQGRHPGPRLGALLPAQPGALHGRCARRSWARAAGRRRRLDGASKRDRAACAPVAPPDGLYLAKSTILTNPKPHSSVTHIWRSIIRMTERSKEKRIVPRRCCSFWRLAFCACAARRMRRASRAERYASSFLFRRAGQPMSSAACSASICRTSGARRSCREYRPGAAGLLGTRQVASSPADGYTLLMASTGAILALRATAPAVGIARYCPRAGAGLADRGAALSSWWPIHRCR